MALTKIEPFGINSANSYTFGAVTVTGNISANYIFGNASGLTGISSSKIYNGTSEANIVASNGNLTISINGTSNVVVVSSSGLALTGNIVNGGANGTGNIESATGYFNTVFAKATSAQYADLAEMYVADADYDPGTVVEFGGDFEITQTTSACSTAVAGIISTNPSYLMNSAQPGEYVLPVALTGRVPCRVQGPVNKGDVLISSNIPGTAQRIGINWQPGCTVGKAMEDINDSVVKVIEVAVGRL